jgi:hypothetical protein
MAAPGHGFADALVAAAVNEGDGVCRDKGLGNGEIGRVAVRDDDRGGEINKPADCGLELVVRGGVARRFARGGSAEAELGERIDEGGMNRRVVRQPEIVAAPEGKDLLATEGDVGGRGLRNGKPGHVGGSRHVVTVGDVSASEGASAQRNRGRYAQGVG